MQKAAARDPLSSPARRPQPGSTQIEPQPAQLVVHNGRPVEAMLGQLAAPSQSSAPADWEGGNMAAWLERREAAAAESAMPMPMPASPQGGSAASSPGQQKASEVGCRRCCCLV